MQEGICDNMCCQSRSYRLTTACSKADLTATVITTFSAADRDSPVQQGRTEVMNVQPKLLSPHWQRKSPSVLQQQLEDKHAAAAQRRSLQQVQQRARQARAQAGRQASPGKTCSSRLILNLVLHAI